MVDVVGVLAVGPSCHGVLLPLLVLLLRGLLLLPVLLRGWGVGLLPGLVVGASVRDGVMLLLACIEIILLGLVVRLPALRGGRSQHGSSTWVVTHRHVRSSTTVGHAPATCVQARSLQVGPAAAMGTGAKGAVPCAMPPGHAAVLGVVVANVLLALATWRAISRDHVAPAPSQAGATVQSSTGQGAHGAVPVGVGVAWVLRWRRRRCVAMCSSMPRWSRCRCASNSRPSWLRAAELPLCQAALC